MAYIKELHAKYTRKRVNDDLLKKPVTNSKQVYKLFHDMQDDAKEKIVCLHLNPKLEILSYEMSSLGTSKKVLADEIEIYRLAMLACASSIILIHNHPSGDPDPSAADKTVVKAIYKMGNIHRIPLLDFIIIGDDKYFSFADKELLPTKNKIK